MTAADLLRTLAGLLRSRAAAAPADPRRLSDDVAAGGAVSVAQMRPTRWLPDGSPDPTSYRPVP